MKYRRGDKVKVSSRKKIEEHPLTTNSMCAYADKIVTIQDIEDKYDKTYFIKEDNIPYIWPECLLELVSREELNELDDEDACIEDKIKTLEVEVEKIDKKISRYQEIARQKLEIKRILDDIGAGRSVTINDMSTSQLNLPDCSDFIRSAVAKALIDTSDELYRLEKEV